MKKLYLLCLITFATLGSQRTVSQQNFNNINSKETYENAKLYVNHMTNGGSQLSLGAKIGAVLEIGQNGNSGYRIYISGALAKNFSQNSSFGTILNYQVDLALFTNGIGSSSLPSQKNRLNIELRNNIGFVFGYNDQNDKVWGRPLTPNIGDNTSVLDDPLDYSAQFGSTFITGINHKRHQRIGFGHLSAAWFNLFYMNDGPPFGKVRLGDKFDRYWTGVGGIGYHRITKNGEVTGAELRYNRYTGDEPLLYDTSSNLRMNYLPHKDESVKFFNKGKYQLRTNFKNSTSIGVNIYQPKITDIQRLIHHNNWAFHPNTTGRYFSFFGQYNFKSNYLK